MGDFQVVGQIGCLGALAGARSAEKQEVQSRVFRSGPGTLRHVQTAEIRDITRGSTCHIAVADAVNGAQDGRCHLREHGVALNEDHFVRFLVVLEKLVHHRVRQSYARR